MLFFLTKDKNVLHRHDKTHILLINPQLFISSDQTFNGKKVFWSKSWPDGTSIDYDGIPFFIVGHEIFECHNGAQHKKKIDQNKPQESSCQVFYQ